MIWNKENNEKLWITVNNTVIHNEKKFCELDSYVGDADHGVTMTRGFEAAIVSLKNSDDSLESQFESMGNANFKAMGGSIGPIYGFLFSEIGKSSKDSEVITTSILSNGINNALKKIKIIASVEEGDRTIVDALSPFAVSLETSKNENVEIEEALIKASEAAKQGMLDTKTMIAKKGRARFLKEKSKGYIDAGAYSFYIIADTISNFINQEESK